MICKKCERRIVLPAFSEGKCEECGKDVITTHIPCYKLCPECSEKLNKCEQCGEPIEKTN